MCEKYIQNEIVTGVLSSMGLVQILVEESESEFNISAEKAGLAGISGDLQHTLK